MSARADPWTGFADPRQAAQRILTLTRRFAATGGKVPIGLTPKDEIWRDGKVVLYRYRRPKGTAVKLPPVLIVHGLVGRHTISDLEPGRSLVERLLNGGADVFVIDWGNPGTEDRYKDFTDYAEYHLGDALAEVDRATGGRGAVLLGICQGGVFALCHAARHAERLRGVALTITPVDFHADGTGPASGLLNLWIRSLPPGLIDEMLAERGLLSGRLIGSLFQQLTPARTLAKYTSGLASVADDPAALDTFLRMEAWLADRPDMPGAAAREWLIGLYHENRLANGRLRIAGNPIDLGAIACPVLNVFGSKDHIVPPACSRALGPLLPGAPYSEIEVPTGHAGVFVSRCAQDTVAPAILDWLAALD